MQQTFTLVERTGKFAREVRLFVKPIFSQLLYRNDVQQLLRASGSVAANYIEAAESLSKKDFVYRLKICRKEAKECILWLNLLDAAELIESEKLKLLDEARQLLFIFNASIATVESKK